MKNANPLYDPATHYRIVVQGPVDAEWLKNFESSAEIIVDQDRQQEDITVLKVNTDQAGIVGLVRRLHGLGMTILQLQVVQIDNKVLILKKNANESPNSSHEENDPKQFGAN